MKNLTIFDALNRIVEASDGDIVLAPPASQSELAALENCLQRPVPDEIVEYLSVANGETRESSGLFGCDDRLLGAEQIAIAIGDHESDEYQIKSDDDLDRKCQFAQTGRTWHKMWIPIVYGYHSTGAYFDCQPTEKGRFGQIVMSAPIDGDFGIAAVSIRDLFNRVLFLEPREELLVYYPFIDPNTGKIIVGANRYYERESHRHDG